MLNQFEVFEEDSSSTLDLPASNYELVAEYNYNICHLKRDEFVHIAENIVGGECKMR